MLDTGPGIPASLQGVIFEKFRQANDRVSYQHGGTGLGLALPKSLADLMHGSLTLQSTEGQRARFTLALPLTARMPPASGPFAFPGPTCLSTWHPSVPRSDP